MYEAKGTENRIVQFRELGFAKSWLIMGRASKIALPEFQHEKTELLIVFSNSVIFLVGQQGIEP